MPVDNSALASASAGVTNVMTNATNAFLQASTNRKDRDFAMKMYNLQRENALADWQKQTVYNSPIEQMKRLKEAGLNPHLIYKNGATNEAQPVRSTESAKWNPKAPQIDSSQIVPTMMMQYDIEQKKVGVDMIRQQIEASKIEQNLKNAQILKTMAETDMSKLDAEGKKLFNEQFKNLMTPTLEAANLTNKKTLAEIGNITATTARVGEEIKKITAETNNVLENTSFLKAKNIREEKQLFAYLKKNEFDIAKTITEIANIKANTENTIENKQKIIAERNSVLQDNRIKEIQIMLDKIKLKYENSGISTPGHGNWIEVMERMFYNAAEQWRSTRGY